MSTAALGSLLGVYPVRDEKMRSSGFPHLRRPSATSATSYNTSQGSLPQHPLSTLEDSGNLNNRGLLGQTTLEPRDASTLVQTGGTKAASSQANPQQQNDSSIDNHSGGDTGGDRIVEERRKRNGGDGYSIHRYSLGRLLGKGGFAKVYLCTAMDTGKNYAVKVVPKANLVKQRAQQKLQAEIKIHRNLKHPHVCQFKHYFEDKTNCYILLELCHNQSLNEMIKRRKRITEPEAAYFMKQLLLAVRYMHGENVIHRDLKLGNLFLDKDMCIKVGDLGLATKVEDKDEKRKTICGTPNYIAPEIIQGDKAKRGHSFEVDVWSMGVILYTVLIGKPPYEAKDVKATYQRILNNEYSFPRHIDVSLSAKSLIKSMLQSCPSDRPTLDEIGGHPFLADDSHVPLLLPSSVLSIAPVWRVNEYGDLVCTTSSGTMDKGGKKPALPRTNSGLIRRPFGSHDPNTHRAGSASTSSSVPRSRGGGGEINMERVVKTAVAAMTASDRRRATTTTAPSITESLDSRTTLVSTAQPPAFEIFNESASPPRRDERDASATRSRRLTEEALLCQQAQALSLGGRGPYAVASSVATTAPSESVFSGSTENDVDLFKFLVDHLGTVMSVIESRQGSYRPNNALSLLRSSSNQQHHGPTKWVTRYVDYTCKYGLGFLLNDGCSGVYFNDSTKTVLDAAGHTFQYMERKRFEDSGVRRGETTVETHTLDNYPEASLKKKVTLLKHFRNYLLQQQVYDGVEPPVPASATEEVRDADLVYVKKWVRTKHAILFSLSNRTIQVIFYDQTELLLTPPDVAFLTYVDKHRQRYTHPFTDDLVGTCPEIEKRLRYAKDILLQLLSSVSTTSGKSSSVV